MEKIIQIAVSDLITLCLTNEGRVFFQKPGEIDWIEATLPPLHTNEIDHTNESHSCTQCVVDGGCLGVGVNIFGDSFLGRGECTEYSNHP